jgi:hypothetical protein
MNFFWSKTMDQTKDIQGWNNWTPNTITNHFCLNQWSRFSHFFGQRQHQTVLWSYHIQALKNSHPLYQSGPGPFVFLNCIYWKCSGIYDELNTWQDLGSDWI